MCILVVILRLFCQVGVLGCFLLSFNYSLRRRVFVYILGSHSKDIFPFVANAPTNTF